MADSFHGVIAFAILGALLLLGTTLRARISALQHSLVPASLIGGVIGFALLAVDGISGYSSSDFTQFTFHFFTLSFMSLCLTGSAPGASGATITKGGSWLSAVWVASLALQGLLGFIVIAGYNALTDQSLSEFLGVIATHGFTQGPGQAIAMGNIWESELGITHAVNFGLIYASMGFVVAFVVGVPVARWAIARGLNFNQQARIDEVFLQGIYAKDTRPVAGLQVTHSANVDTLAYHLGILGVAYILTNTYLTFMQGAVAGVSLGGVRLDIFFSHNLFFLHGLITCVIIRALINRLGLGHMVDDETQRRITGSAVDFMVIATVMSINFGLLMTYFAPILLVCLAVSFGTALLCFVLGQRMKHLNVERALTVFGCCCGSTGTGLLLLRILDPDMSTPIAKELAFFNIAILIASFHILGLMAPVLPQFDIGFVFAVYTATVIVAVAAAYFLGKRIPAHQS